MEELLAAEMAARVKLNDLQSQRDTLDDACKQTLQELNQLKHELYKVGFTGNIMRDENGNRVMSLKK